MDEQNRLSLSLSLSFSLLPQLSSVLRHDERQKKTTLIVVVTMN